MSAEAHRRALDVEAEQEVDFGRYWRALAARWWLLILGIVAGAIIGYLATIGGSTSYNASAEVYLGVAIAPGGSAQVSAPSTQLALVGGLATAESTVRAVAAQVGLPTAMLRGHITSKPILGITGAKVGTPAPLLVITVTGSPPGKIAAAANAIADIIVKQIAPYQSAKLQNLKNNLAYDTRQLVTLDERLKIARANQAQVLQDTRISPTDKLIALGNLNSVITLALQQQNTLQQDTFQVRAQLALAQEIEASRIVSPAVASRNAGPSRRTGVAIGALLGLIVGILAAILWEPVARGLKSRPA